MLIDIYMDGFSLHWRSAPFLSALRAKALHWLTVRPNGADQGVHILDIDVVGYVGNADLAVINPAPPPGSGGLKAVSQDVSIPIAAPR
jgi:hypothetical protein